jgi:hypothetical protein
MNKRPISLPTSGGVAQWAIARRSCAPTTLRTSPESRVIGRKSFPVLAAPLSAQHTRPTARRPPPHRRLGMLGAVQVILALSHLRPTTRLHWRSSAPKTLRTSPDSRVIGRGSSSVLAAPLSAQHTRPTARRQPPRRRPGVLGAVQSILALSHLRPTTRLHWRSSAPTTLRTSPDSRVIGRGSSSVLAAPPPAQHTRPTARRQPPRRRPGVLGAVQSFSR